MPSRWPIYQSSWHIRLFVLVGSGGPRTCCLSQQRVLVFGLCLKMHVADEEAGAHGSIFDLAEMPPIERRCETTARVVSLSSVLEKPCSVTKPLRSGMELRRSSADFASLTTAADGALRTLTMKLGPI
jgi:hypothetical protein